MNQGIISLLDWSIKLKDIPVLQINKVLKPNRAFPILDNELVLKCLKKEDATNTERLVLMINESNEDWKIVLKVNKMNLLLPG